MTEDEEERLQQSLKRLEEKSKPQRLMSQDPSKLPLSPDDTHCNFCGKGPTEYKKEVVAGPNVRICGECIELCMKFLKEIREERDS